MAGTYRNTIIAAYGNGSATLTGPTPSSGRFTLNNITFNTFPNSLAATFTHAKYGSGVVWLDQTNWRFLINMTWDKQRTYLVAITSPKQTVTPQSAGTIILGGIGVALTAVGVAASIGAAFAAAPILVTVGAIAGGIGLGMALEGILMDMGDYAAGQSTFTMNPTASSPLPILMNPPQYNDGSGPSQYGGTNGSTPVTVTT